MERAGKDFKLSSRDLRVYSRTALRIWKTLQMLQLCQSILIDEDGQGEKKKEGISDNSGRGREKEGETQVGERGEKLKVMSHHITHIMTCVLYGGKL